MRYILLFCTKSPKSGLYFILIGDLKLGDSFPTVKVKCSTIETIYSYQNNSIE